MSVGFSQFAFAFVSYDRVSDFFPANEGGFVVCCTVRAAINDNVSGDIFFRVFKEMLKLFFLFKSLLSR